MKKTFQIEIGEENGSFYAIVKSVQENKVGPVIEAFNMRLLMSELSKTVRKRSIYLRRFPPPEPSPIVTLEQDAIGNSRLILPENGN